MLNRKTKKRLVLLSASFLVFFSFFILTNSAFAQFGLEYATATGLGTTGLKPLVFKIINVILEFLGIVALIIILYGGFVWMTSAGNKDKIEKAKKILINGLIGLALILASWGIANFVLGQLWGATGGVTAGSPCDCATEINICSGCLKCKATPNPSVCAWQNDATCGPACVGLPGAQTFYAQKFQPTSPPDAIRNAVVRISFKGVGTSSSPAAVNYGVNFSVLDMSGGGAGILVPADVADGYPKIVGNRIDFKPDTACPAPNDSYKCFAESKDYKIVVTNDLKNTNGVSLDCVGHSCEATFHTNNIIDTTPPSISVSALSQICAGTAINNIDAHGTDDSGIAFVDFYYNTGGADTTIGTDNAPSCVGLPPNVACSAQINWDTTGPSFSVGGEYFLKAKATDLDSNEKTSANYRVILRSAHCCNTIKDADEESVDCGGADCSACAGSACDIDAATAGCQPDDMTCASVFCDTSTCLCQQLPIIDWLSPDNGAPGNLITIGGRHFGNTPGTVTFLNGGLNAPFPSTVNPDCIDTWTDNQIVIVVPAGAVASPLRVTTSVGYSDETNNSRGPILADFDVNTTIRPGLCKLNPTSGQIAIQVSLTGIRFGPAATSRTIEFGNDVNFVLANNINWLSNTQAHGDVPNILAGATSVRAKIDSEYSNYLSFNVLSGTAGGPHIDYIDPTSGPTGQYMTIFGSNFGSQTGVATFSGINADVNFPAKCPKNFWHNTYIIVKTPTVAAGTNYNVKVKTSKGAESNEVNFTGAAGTPGPGICGLVPDNGPVNTPVNFYGDNFGPSASPGQVFFYNTPLPVVATISAWDKQEVKANVPSSAITGATYIQDSAGKNSNKVPFKVGICQDDSQCDIAVPEKCCADKTCRATCPEKIKATYGWSFTTGDYFVARDCLKEIGIPTTGPKGDAVCTNAQTAVRFTTLIDNNTVVDAGDPSLHPNIIVEKCADDNCDPASNTVVNGNVAVALLGTDPQTEGFTFTPVASFDQGTVYKVTLRGGEGGITDEKGIPLIDDFSWTFKTRPDGKQCQLDKIMVEPSQAKLVILGATQDYIATITAKEDPCFLINPTFYNWTWESSDTKVAEISGFVSNTATAIAMGPGDTDIKASIQSEKKQGLGKLTVDLSGLQVLSTTPTCDTACTNAQIRVRFSNWVDDNTLTFNNIKLYKCSDKKCLNLSGLPGINLNNPANGYFWNGLTGDSLLDIDPAANQLDASSYYRVVIKGGESGIKNYLGGGLGNPNYKSATGEECDSSAGCDAVTCLNTAGECVPNSLGCSAGGLHTGSVASSCGNGVVEAAKGENCDDGNTKDGDGCSAKCLLEGSTSLAVCGDGIIGKGEACDDKNQTAGDGCSAKCLLEGSNENYGSICGNGAKETGEDCDDGNTSSGDGCSSKCLAEGVSGSVCGDGKIGVGEDCDDGNTSSGDGCSSICLNEGASGLAVCGNGVVENGKVNDSYSWVFGTGFGVCQPEKAEVIPDNINLAVGQTIKYTVNLYSAPDTCSETGQLLDGTKYNWQWNSTNVGVATITSDGKPTQNAAAVGIGQAQICSSTDLTGDGNPDVSDCADLIVGQTSGPGIPCHQSANSCCDSGVFQCSAGYTCLENLGEPECPTEAAGSGKYPGCLCCCDPTDDQCPAPLSCSANKAPCSGGNRGLCCGCKNDAECGDPTNVGCGKDTCCHTRPTALNTSPAGSGVCRNVKIKVEFSEAMQTASFVGKVEVKNTADGSFVKGVVTSGGNTILFFNPEKALLANTTYEVTIKKEVLSQNQISMSADQLFTFSTGDIICSADYLKVSIQHDADPLAVTNQDLFACVRSDCSDDINSATAGNQHSYLAEAMDITGVSLTGYDYSWLDSDPDDIVSHDTTGSAAIVITANNKNGQAVYNITAAPQATSDNAGIVSNRVNITNFICENPWPSVDTWPWIDDSVSNINSSCNTPAGCSNTDTHFQLMYCRDAGAAGTADDLPALSNPPVIRGQSGDFLKEYLFVIP